MKAHLVRLARVFAKANEISLGLVFTHSLGFSRINIVFTLLSYLCIVTGL